MGDLTVTGPDGSRYSYLDGKIKESMRRSAQEMVRLGCYLRCMSEEGAWRLHYGTFDGYLRQELHTERTMANRFIAANKKYSVEGTVRLDERWEGYSQSLLVEMLDVPPELEARITPDMTVREVRELKRRAAGNVATSQRANPGPGGPVVPVPEGWSLDDAPEIEDALGHEECVLRDYAKLEAEGVILVRAMFRQRLTVAAMRAFLQGLRAGPQPEPVPEPQPEPEPQLQPELPRLKNDGQRREWIEGYKSWGLWYRDEHLGVEYYKYDFVDGTRLVVEAYPAASFGGSWFLHLVGAPKPPQGSYGPKWSRYRTYCRYANSVTEVVEFLKYLQKKK